MLVRVSSRQGIKPISTSPNETVQELKENIQTALSIPVENQQLTIRNGTQLGSSLKLLNPNATLESLGIGHGQTVFLESPETSLKPAESEEILRDLKVNLERKSGDRYGHSKKFEDVYNSKNVKEDDIDIIMRNTDGWVHRPLSSSCQHSEAGKCTHCMPVAPWNVQSHEKFENLNLKHISFHSWLREKEYRSLNNPLFLDDPVWRIENSNQLSARQGAFSVVLDRQTYRHVDHIEFERSELVERFIASWRATGLQRCGHLFGRYIVDPSGIPLGIRAVVVAIYEPPQQSSFDDIVLLRDPHEQYVEQLAQSFGLTRVGFIWTALKTDKNRQLISDRSTSTYLLSSRECVRMCIFQNRYFSPCRQSNSEKYGSKFVSVLIYGNSDGNVDIAAYQMSNQVARLVRDGVVRPTKQNSGLLRVKPSTNAVIYPDIFYTEKDEYGNMVRHKANPTFPNVIGIISVRHSFPKEPSPTFKYLLFPIENRFVYDIAPGVEALRLQLKEGLPNCLSDWHLLVYLLKTVSPESMTSIVNVVSKKGQVTQEFCDMINSIAMSLDGVGDKHTTFGTTETSSFNVNRSASSLSSSRDSDPTTSSRVEDMVKAIVGIGFTETQAREALAATGHYNIDSALDLLTGTF